MTASVVVQLENCYQIEYLLSILKSSVSHAYDNYGYTRSLLLH